MSNRIVPLGNEPASRVNCTSHAIPQLQGTRRPGVRIPSRPPDFKGTYIIFENPVLRVSRTVTNPSQIVESIANALRINAAMLMSILRALD
jgi:hypothetical protein